MRGKAVLVLALMAGGCNLLLGLEPPEDHAADSGDADGAGTDAVPGDAAPDDATPIDGLVPPTPDARLPIDAPPGPCTPIDDGNECTLDLCSNGVPVNPPVPRDTLCNGWQDQCDGAGHCVDCTNSGGCGECCTCSLQQVCIPA